MKKILGETLLGLTSSSLGVYCFYLFIKSLNDTPTLLFLIPAIGLVAFGIFLLLRAGKYDDSVIQKLDETELSTPTQDTSSLQEHSSMIEEWQKVNEMKDKLKLLKTATEEEVLQ